MRQFAITIVIFTVLVGAGCSESNSPHPASQKSPVHGLPAEFTVRQRSTTAAPGSDGRLLITIDDITRGQVIVSAATASGTDLLPARSMSPKTTAAFDFGGQSLRLRLQRLDNALIGEDFATFELSSDDGSLTEAQKIEKLIQVIADLSDATFIRNGAEHSALEAAEHLRMKWGSAGSGVNTAEQFIDGVASRSSVTGRPYRIRFAGGRTVEAGEFLREHLQQIEQDR